ncbi:1-phosphofructokinase family hexose kinase [Kibdelosporangium phytohabitans]|uniref:1-phosphofructokinase family hexose kinase n=1 Tax=Kibdelosporangium phytohabitans TaxID=860235 RepID=UPI000A85F779|nr:1-phosphofructokinase family hexose kinase [Kibdelosporangium phytohabitans]MBE1461160.1 tagatose 6-phosphate kinase [Kibdelosporangium phytohabitans]
MTRPAEILTVTLNAALDVTYQISTLSPGDTHRVHHVHTRPGGKGVNVADVLTQLGHPVTATGFAGPELTTRLPGFVPITGQSRRTVTIVEQTGTGATLFTEPGPVISPGEWQALLDRFDQLAAHARVVVLSGSLPPGLPADTYAQLITRSPAPVILDTDGDPLRHGLTARPALIKPNLDELTRLLGREPDLPADCHTLGVPVAATLGAGGALLATPDGTWRARPPGPVPGNPTGAGDAFTAALARGLACHQPWPTVLADAVALSAAAVRSPAAGSFDPAAYQEFTTAVTVEES